METEAEKSNTSLAAPSLADFESMLNESFDNNVPREGTVVEGRVIGIENNQAIIDVGFKTEGRVDVKEFARPGREVEIEIGDTVEVYLDRIENARGEAVLSREKANREAAWDRLENANADSEHVEGAIFGRVKGGFSVDLGGAVAFLPGSQVDVRPVHNISPLMNIPQPFQIVKMDRRRGNIVVSRRAVLEESSAAERTKVLERLNKGDIVEGVVKNIVEFGGFVDLGGIDGLLHVTDMAWRRVSHPSEVIAVGDTLRVQVIKINRETQRISLGLKQLEPDPWEGIAAKYPASLRTMGRVANITDFGAFVELEPGVEGLIHVSEMSWTKKNFHPGKIVSTSQEVEVMVLNTDAEKRRISLGLKQCMDNPWEVFAAQHPEGSVVEGPVRSVADFGLFVGLEGGIDGMVHHSDLSWEKSGQDAIRDFKKGETVSATVLEVDAEKERISLGIKQAGGDPFAQATTGLKKGSVVSGMISKIEVGGIEVMVDGVQCFVRKQDLSRERSEQRPDRFAVDQRVEARVTNIDRSNRKLSISIKAHEIAIEKDAVRQYGSSASGAVLGEILAPALRQRGQEEEAENDAKAEAGLEEDNAKSAEADAEPEKEEAESEADAQTAEEKSGAESDGEAGVKASPARKRTAGKRDADEVENSEKDSESETLKSADGRTRKTRSSVSGAAEVGEREEQEESVEEPSKTTASTVEVEAE